MKIFFACNKPSSSSLNNYYTNPDNSSKNNEEKNNKENLLLSTNDINDSTYSLEIIDYPYSSNYNDDKTVTMNSAKKNIKTKDKTNILKNNYNPQKILKDETNNSIKFFNYDFYNNSSNSSSAIINNEDIIIQNKMLLTAYYQNYNNLNLNNINSKNNNKKKQMKCNIQKNKIKGKKIKDSTLELNVEYPNPDSQDFFSKLHKNCTFNFSLNKTDFAQNNLSKKLKINFKKSHFFAINKTLEYKKKNYTKNKSKKTIETFNSDILNLSKSYSKVYNTCDVHKNKSYNSFKDYKIHFGKIKRIINKKDESKKFNIIKKRKNLNNHIVSDIQKHKTIEKIKPVNRSIKSILLKKNTFKSKQLHSSNTDFKSDLLSHRIKKDLASQREIKSFRSKKDIIQLTNKRIKVKNTKPKLIIKKKLPNPFLVNEEKTVKK